MSIRLSQLALLLAFSMLATAIGGIATTWWIADKEFKDVLDHDLKDESELLAELLATRGVNLSADALQEFLTEAFEEDEEETLWVTVHDARRAAPVSNLGLAAPPDAEDDNDGEVDLVQDGQRWHGYREAAGPVIVTVLRREDRYEEVQDEILEDIVTPALIGSAINLLLLALLIAFFLWPVTRLARQLETRSADSLEPLKLGTPAREVRLLQDSLNKLMRDVDDVLTRERQFTSDVAHELRTPLTTVKLELSGDEPDLDTVRVEMSRLGRLVEQLLVLARLEQRRWQQSFATIALDELSATVVARFAEQFESAGLQLESTLAPAHVEGDATLLEALLQNLLQNVRRHASGATRVMLTLESTAQGARLRLCDNGCGIDAATRRQMDAGATRLDSKSAGLGLGLAICHRIADVHNASLHFRQNPDGGSGLEVDLQFPA